MMKDHLKSIKMLYGTEGNFNLRRYFSFYSLLIIVVLTVILSGIVYWNQRNALIDYSISSAKMFAHQINANVSRKIMDSSLIKENNLLIEDNTNFLLQLDKISESFLNEYGDVKKMKIFDHEGKVVYSSDPNDIGLMNTGRNIKKAMTGQTVTELTRRYKEFQDDLSNKEKKYSIDILEIYVPIYSDVNNPVKEEIIGAFEIYTDVSTVYQLISREFYKVPLLLLFSMGILYMFLQVVIKKASGIINKRDAEINLYTAELNEAQKRIRSAIDQVIEDQSFHIRLQSDDLLKCWEIKNCTHVACPSYKSENLRCWQVSGTFCGGKVQGVFASKYGDCRKCEVYQNAFKDRINLIGESFNNMMVLLESKHMELKKLNERLNILIDTDPLTETGNRRSFQKRMESIHLLSLRYNHPYSIIVCDVDYFKSFNDTYGHQKGDYALVAASNAMKTSLRRTDEIFRWGGEEFIIILPQQNLFAALKVAENLRTTVESLGIAHTGSPSKVLTVSVGVACNIADNVKYISWESVIKQADDELYKAKAAGKNCVSPSVNVSSISEETSIDGS